MTSEQQNIQLAQDVLAMARAMVRDDKAIVSELIGAMSRTDAQRGLAMSLRLIVSIFEGVSEKLGMTPAEVADRFLVTGDS